MSNEMSETIYLSGPMSGIPEYNYPAFQAAAESMRAVGIMVISPHEINHGISDYAQCMKNDIRALLQCDAIAMMEGWHDSTGASIEIAVARVCGLRVTTVEKEIKRKELNK